MRPNFHALREARLAAVYLRELLARDAGEYEVALETLAPVELERIASTWEWTARASQLRPEDSRPILTKCAGRGEGKTRMGAEETLTICEEWGSQCKGILASKTIGDVRKVMIKGESGLEACARRRGYEVRYVANHGVVYHPSGAELYVVTSEKPDVPRGLQSNWAWLDEISSWMNALETFSNIMFGWRLPCPGGQPLMLITTTPKPNPVMQALLKGKEYRKRTTIVGGSTRDNVDNLAPGTLETLESIYGGTRLGQQELEGILLEGQGTITSQEIVHATRVERAPDLMRRVVALDPSITATDDSDAAGIVVVGADALDYPHAYVLADHTIESATFSMWARAAVLAFLEFECECVVAEINQGGTGIVEAIEAAAAAIAEEQDLRGLVVPVRTVWAQKSKKARAEPVGSLYEKGRVHHVGIFPQLEKEITEWVPGMPSPNRMDALVYAVTHLLLGDKTVGPLSGYLT